MKPNDNNITPAQKKVIWRKRRRKRRMILRLLLIVLALIGIGLSVFLIVRKSGKAALYKKTESASMTIGAKETLEDYDPDAVEYKGEIYHYNKDILTFLVMGIDKMTPVNRNVPSSIDHRQGGQADALFLVSADPHKKRIFVVGVNRNALAPVDIFDKDGQYLATQMEPVSLQHGFGTGLEDSCELQVKSVSELFYKLPISGYAAINMGVFPKINDAVGGVELPLLERMSGVAPVLNQPEGTVVTLQGNAAFDYVHDRNSKEFASANKRLARQKQYISAFIPKAISKVKENPGFALDLYDLVSKYMVTDVSGSQVVYLASEMLGYTFDAQDIYTLDGEMVLDDDGFEKFHVDDDALYDLIMQLYYEKVE